MTTSHGKSTSTNPDDHTFTTQQIADLTAAMTASDLGSGWTATDVSSVINQADVTPLGKKRHLMILKLWQEIAAL